MTYSELLEFLKEMDAEDLSRKVVISCDGSWHEVCAATAVAWIKEPEEGSEQYPLGQVILEC